MEILFALFDPPAHSERCLVTVTNSPPAAGRGLFHRGLWFVRAFRVEAGDELVLPFAWLVLEFIERQPATE